MPRLPPPLPFTPRQRLPGRLLTPKAPAFPGRTNYLLAALGCVGAGMPVAIREMAPYGSSFKYE